jgi:hypothetical protein
MSALEWLGLSMLAVLVVDMILRLVWRRDGFAQTLRVFDTMFAEKEDKWFDARGDCPGISRPSYRAAMAFKAEMGEMRYTDANRCIVGDFTRKWFKENYPDMRHCDVVEHMVYAEQLALTPTRAAVVAARYAKSAAVKTRRGEATMAR